MAKNKDRASRMERIKAKLASNPIGGEGGFDYIKLKEGRNKLRIIPGVGDMEDFFWQQASRHYIPDTKQSFFCPDFTIDEPCPICEFRQEMYNAGDNASKELAQSLKATRRYWMNVIDRNAKDKGPQIFTPGIKIAGPIIGFLTDPEYGDLIFDEEKGLDIVVKRSGTGRYDTTYDVVPTRTITPLSDDEDQIDEWIEAAIDLTPVLLTEDPTQDRSLKRDDEGNLVAAITVMPYARIKAEFEAIALGDEEDDDDDTPADDEEEDDEDDVTKTIRKRRARRSRRGR